MPTVIKVNAMTPELAVNLVCPGLIIPLGTVGNGLALWTLLFSDALRKRIVRYYVQGGWGGWPTGNRKKLSSCQAQLGQATCLAVA